MTLVHQKSNFCCLKSYLYASETELQMIRWRFIDSLKVYDTGTMLILEKKRISLTGYWATSMQLKLGFWLIFWMTEVISTYPTKTSTGLQTTEESQRPNSTFWREKVLIIFFEGFLKDQAYGR